VLKRCSKDKSNPFVVRLHYSFMDSDTLFLALDFHPGGDLATQLARWGRLGRDRARFYMAEICEGIEGLHRAGVIYRDLKPENILISFDGHIVLTDFGSFSLLSRSRRFPLTFSFSRSRSVDRSLERLRPLQSRAAYRYPRRWTSPSALARPAVSKRVDSGWVVVGFRSARDYHFLVRFFPSFPTLLHIFRWNRY
jgi:serine/threonine protein kinase